MRHIPFELHVYRETASNAGAMDPRDSGTTVYAMLLRVMMKVTMVERDPEVDFLAWREWTHATLPLAEAGVPSGGLEIVAGRLC